MNFEDEQYVRLYTRKTITTRRLGWEGRTVLWHLMCECDRVGVLEVGSGDLVEALTALLVDVPEDVIKVAVPRLESQGVTQRHGTQLLIVRFLEAQEAQRSDKVRAKEYRQRRRSKVVTPGDDTDTQRDDGSQGVTIRHEESSGVMLRHDSSLSAGLCSAVPSSTDPAPVSLEDRAKRWIEDPNRAAFEFPQPERWPEVVSLQAKVASVFGLTVEVPRTPNDPRCRKALERYAEGYSEAKLLRAIDGAKQSRAIAESREYQTLSTILRDGAQVDKLAALSRPLRAVLPRETLAEREAREEAEENARRAARGVGPVMKSGESVVDAAEIDRIVGSIG